MASTIPTHYYNTYRAGIRLLQQQATSRFRDAMMIDTEPDILGEKSYYDQLESTSMTPITDRNGKAQVTDDTHLRRAVVFSPAEKASLVSRQDERRVFNNPRNRYAMNAVRAANRYLDDKFIDAIHGTALTGKDGGTSVTWASVASTNDVGVVAGGMTLDQLLDGREILDANENDEDDDMFRWYAAINAAVNKQLLKVTEIVNIDYNTQRVLTNGSLDTFLGITFKHSQRLKVVADDLEVPLWVKASMQGAIAADAEVDMDRIPERRNSILVRVESDVGATRLDEKGVVKIITDL